MICGKVTVSRGTVWESVSTRTDELDASCARVLTGDEANCILYVAGRAEPLSSKIEVQDLCGHCGILLKARAASSTPSIEWWRITWAVRFFHDVTTETSRGSK